MSTQRIYIDGTRVTVSKPGYDASSPPAIDYTYLALDSRLNQGRPLQIGLVPSYAFLTGGKILYGTTYPKPPAVDIVAYTTPSAGTAIYNKFYCCRDSNGSQTFQRSSYTMQMQTDGFYVVDALYTYQHTGVYGSTLNMYYIAWQVQ